jgi:uncharacterized membrane protein
VTEPAKGPNVQTRASTTESSRTAKSSRRLVAAVATVAAAAALAGPTVVSAYSTQEQGSRVAAGGCGYICGDNHNEVMATTVAR